MISNYIRRLARAAVKGLIALPTKPGVLENCAPGLIPTCKGSRDCYGPMAALYDVRDYTCGFGIGTEVLVFQPLWCPQVLSNLHSHLPIISNILSRL